MDYKGRVVVVTGASRGLGRSIAIAYAKHGADVVINYHKNDLDAEITKAAIEGYGVRCLTVKGDIGKEEDVIKLKDLTIDEFGHVDILVNNAGIVFDLPFEERRADHWKKTLNTNLISIFLCAKHFEPYLQKSDMASILNISSTNGLNTIYPSSMDYDASKAGIISLTKNLAVQLAPSVNVNSIAPGWIETSMNADLPASFIEEETKHILKQRFATPEEIANVAIFLTSDMARYITAQTICVDGGLKTI